MHTAYEALQPLRVKAEVSCFKLKGEDFHSRHTDIDFCALVGDEKVHTTCALFGVYDGHGGKRAAEFASKQVRLARATHVNACMYAGLYTATFAIAAPSGFAHASRVQWVDSEYRSFGLLAVSLWCHPSSPHR